MTGFRCVGCGSVQFHDDGGFRVCSYCGARYPLFQQPVNVVAKNPSAQSGSSVSSDVAMLLGKCKAEPWNARRYANLILDIDPNNSEAKKYL